MAHKRKTVTDLEQRVGERKKKYVRYQEGAELYSMGLNTFREIAREAKATVRSKGIDSRGGIFGCLLRGKDVVWAYHGTNGNVSEE